MKQNSQYVYKSRNYLHKTCECNAFHFLLFSIYCISKLLYQHKGRKYMQKIPQELYLFFHFFTIFPLTYYAYIYGLHIWSTTYHIWSYLHITIYLVLSHTCQDSYASNAHINKLQQIYICQCLECKLHKSVLTNIKVWCASIYCKPNI